jgi:hypothetical protein
VRWLFANAGGAGKTGGNARVLPTEAVMDPQLVREYRARYDAVAQVEAAERQASTLEERWERLNALVRMAVALGVDLRAESPDDAEVWARWARLKVGAE